MKKKIFLAITLSIYEKNKLFLNEKFDYCIY